MSLLWHVIYKPFLTEVFSSWLITHAHLDSPTGPLNFEPSKPCGEIQYCSRSIYIYIYTYVHTYIHTYIHEYIHTYIHMHIHIYLYNPIYIYIHISLSIYIHNPYIFLIYDNLFFRTSSCVSFSSRVQVQHQGSMWWPEGRGQTRGKL